MPSAREHVGVLKRLLPSGPAWPTSEQSDDTDDFTLLLTALAQEPARIDAAYELILNELIPDNALTDLASWERVLALPEDCTREVERTDAERLAAIRGKLRGRGAVNRAYLETVMAGLRGAAVSLLDRSTPQFRVGTSAVGQPVRGEQWLATWILEYAVEGVATVDDFESWTGTGAGGVTNAQFGSPVTLEQDAAEVVFTSGQLIEHAIAGTASGDTVRFSVWLRSAAGTKSIKVGVIGRDGADYTTTRSVTAGWRRFDGRVSVGTGVSTPKFRIAEAGAVSATIYAANAVAGVMDEIYECQVEHQPPINTTGEFNVIGENG
jgi:uncharacterized protein YmfQ (DUF2313 family)